MAAALTNPTGVELWRLGASELLGLISDLSPAVSAIQALQLRAIADADRRGAAVEQGAASSARWLTEATRVAPGAAARMVRLGLGLTREPAVAAALDGGTISVEHAHVILDVLRRLPADFPPDGAAACRAYLLDAAATEDPQTLSRRGKDLSVRLAPEDAELTEEQAVARRELRISDCGGGLHKISGWLDTEAAELAKSVLSPLAAPRWPHPAPPRTGSRIRAARPSASVMRSSTCSVEPLTTLVHPVRVTRARTSPCT